MNDARRKAIGKLIDELNARMAEVGTIRSQVEDIANEIETLKDEETDYKDAMPESFQQGDKGDRADAAIDAFDGAHDTATELDSSFEDIETNIQEVIDKLEEARTA